MSRLPVLSPKYDIPMTNLADGTITWKKIEPRGDPGPIPTVPQVKEPVLRWREKVLLALVIPCAGFILAALLSTTPAPDSSHPFTELRAQEVQKKFPDGRFISTTTYQFCSEGWYWFAYSDGGMRGSAARCWR